MSTLADSAARKTALTAHDRTLLVEAGAGSGKTAIMAGRVTMLLLAGISPRNIAAITFTEAAAGELLTRIREFLIRLEEGLIPLELQVALPDGLTDAQISNLQGALRHIDELSCSTIHGFCQQLIMPYPVEAGTDPGATIMEANEGALQLSETINTWLRQHLDEDNPGIVSELVWEDPKAVEMVHELVTQLQRERLLSPPEAGEALASIQGFGAAVRSFVDHVAGAPIQVDEVNAIAAGLREIARQFQCDSEPDTARLISMLRTELTGHFVTKTGTLKAFQNKGRYQKHAESKQVANAIHDEAKSYYDECGAAWDLMKSAIATLLLNRMAAELRPVTEKFMEVKRLSARLDFDDLLYLALELLRAHEPVRKALADRYRHILVDEFQDTDPVQAEILWRLCRTEDAADTDWRDFDLRPGALFLVGDPKQAIYRFRGADVHTYLQARETLAAASPDSILSISTNFRSQPGILDFANAVFRDRLAAAGQPGFTPLTPFVANLPGTPQVARLTIEMPEPEEPKVDDLRAAEGTAVADLISRMLGSHQVRDRDSGEARACQPGDIALLAPVGTDLHHFETALEQLGVPISTQAGKGFFRQQEVQDMVALTRLLADPKDTLAFAAFLRGPMVGLTDEQLLDIVEQQTTGRGLHIDLNLAEIPFDHARDIVGRLQRLRERVNATTPHALLSEAVNQLNIRSVLNERHAGRAERALANLDLYLEQLTPYPVRGLRAAAADLNALWDKAEKSVEGHIDAPENAVSIMTMHSSKGLEWPVVIPINAMGRPQSRDPGFTDRSEGVIYSKVFGVKPTGYGEAREREQEQEQLERVRTWYVALTRARDTLVITHFPGRTATTWASPVELDRYVEELDEFGAGPMEQGFTLQLGKTENGQTAEVFAGQSAAISASRRTVIWKAPSRDESSGSVLPERDAEVGFIGTELEPVTEPETPLPRGGSLRGIILHKLMEEVLTGETADDSAALGQRADELIIELDQEATEDAVSGLFRSELAACVTRSLALPQVSEIRARLMPELPIGYSRMSDGTEEVIVGISDAVAYGDSGTPEVVVDWKSDVKPAAAVISHYRNQISTYMHAVGARRGLIVLMTSGHCIEVVNPQREDVQQNAR